MWLKTRRPLTSPRRCTQLVGVTAGGAVVVVGAGGGEVQELGAGELGGHGQRVTLSPRQLLPVVGRLLRGSVGRGPAAERAPRGGVEVKHQREHRLAGHVVKLDLAPAQVLPGREGVDLAAFGGPLGGGGVVVRVLDVHLPPRFAGEDVRLAAAQPDVASGPR